MIGAEKRVLRDWSWFASVGSAAWSPVPRCEAFGAPISLEEHTSLMPRPAAKIRILHFKNLRHSDMASVLITTFEIFTRVSPNNSLERLAERGIGFVTD